MHTHTLIHTRTHALRTHALCSTLEIHILTSRYYHYIMVIMKSISHFLFTCVTCSCRAKDLRLIANQYLLKHVTNVKNVFDLFLLIKKKKKIPADYFWNSTKHILFCPEGVWAEISILAAGDTIIYSGLHISCMYACVNVPHWPRTLLKTQAFKCRMAESGWTVTTADAKIRIISWADKESKILFLSIWKLKKKKSIFFLFKQRGQ